MKYLRMFSIGKCYLLPSRLCSLAQSSSVLPVYWLPQVLLPVWQPPLLARLPPVSPLQETPHHL
jgi:hypothetical protein